MTCFDTQIWLYGTLVEVCVDYVVIDDVAEVEEARIIGVYSKFDNVVRRDYASLGADIPLDISEMSNELYDQLAVKAQEHEDTYVGDMSDDD